MLRRVPAAVLTAVTLLPGGALAQHVGFSASPPPEARAAFERADRALVDADLATAAREFERAAALAPDYAQPYAYYAYALTTTDRAAAAAAAERYRKLAEAEPARAAYWYAYGRFEQDRGKREAAFRKVVELEPDAPWGHLGLGFAARAAGDGDAALPLYEKAYALAPKEPAVINGLVAVYAGVKARRPRALELLHELATIAPGTFYAENAFDAYAAGVTEPAEWPSLAEFYVRSYPKGKNLGQAYAITLQALAAKDRSAAATAARPVLAALAGPRYAADRGRIFEEYVLAPAREAGRPALDRLAAELAASTEDSPHVYLALGRAYLGAGGDLAAATKMLARADALYRAMRKPDPALGDALSYEYGRALEGTGDLATAASILERIAPGARVAPDAAAALAAIYTKLGNRAKAFEAGARAAALRPLPENRDRLAAAAGAAGKSPAEAEAAVRAVRDSVAKPAADFTLTSLDGRQVSLASYRGKAVLLNFWFPG